MSSESLAAFFATHQRLRDCLKVARRAVEAESVELLDSTAFIGTSKEQAQNWIDEARQSAEDLAIVALWAWFERYLIEYAQIRAGTVATATPTPFAEELSAKVEREIERWRLDDVLDLFKSLVEAGQIGIAKQIKDYRDWVAHRNPERLPPAQTEPRTAYSVLAAIIDAIERAR